MKINIFMCTHTHIHNFMHIQYLGDWAHVYCIQILLGGTSVRVMKIICVHRKIKDNFEMETNISNKA